MVWNVKGVKYMYAREANAVSVVLPSATRSALSAQVLLRCISLPFFIFFENVGSVVGY